MEIWKVICKVILKVIYKVICKVILKVIKVNLIRLLNGANGQFDLFKSGKSKVIHVNFREMRFSFNTTL